jgi:glycosyltransferase involved in cell wall biosynthesis
MKVLFVSSGNRISGLSNIVLKQGKSLVDRGIEVEYFLINGKGIKGYLNAVPQLKKRLTQNKFDLIHAHYSLSGIVAALTGVRPLVVSLMGSDVKSSRWNKYLIKIFNYYFWDKIIVKTYDMVTSLGISNIEVIPNGVNLSVFYPQDKVKSQEYLKWDPIKKHILFLSDPSRHEKNFQLFDYALKFLNSEILEIHSLCNIEAELVPVYLNASDVVVSTSIWEGSPNSIKEAMACNVPVVSTDVGDVKWIFGETKGCFLTSFDENDLASKLILAINFSDTVGRTEGIQRILKLELKSENIAERIKCIYEVCTGIR